MARHRPASGVFIAAAGCYAATCALGVCITLGWVDTRRIRWVHHALYTATASLTAVALSAAWWGRPRERSRRAALALSPAVLPLAAIPFAGTHTRRHPLLALTAAPFLIAAVVRSRR